ncbi:SulP family inorganic anion transporter [Alkalihalobacterium alkalinitrilicum]|uniref:SulP family inorganic anion transporter n=1 Tax=Alkalihalobacterium alkalinitrilicum TaxID=427920 RepID=UPI00130355A5|nr:SulP family inorganic anion transporter [Alkalihalobacterium alkalinitrilicum]
MSYWKNKFQHDVVAGLVVAILIIPQAIAYAILAGVPPVVGLYSATIPVLIYLLFGTSPHLSVGPVAIVSLLIFSGVSSIAVPGTDEYFSLVITVTLFVGLLQVFSSIFHFGKLIEWIPYSVIKGFTSACAILIAFSQLENLIGFSLGHSTSIVHTVYALFTNINNIHIATFLIGLISILLILTLNSVDKKLPTPLFVVVICTASVSFFQLDHFGVPIIGQLPQGFPTFTVPVFTGEILKAILPTVIIIAFIGYIESIAVAKVIAKKERYNIGVNKELTSLGLANTVGSFFSSIPIAGGISRSAVNYDSGAKTKMASLITTLCIFLTLLFFTPLFYYLPKPTLAAIIMVAIAKLINIKELWLTFKMNKNDGILLMATLSVTLLYGPEWGILTGCTAGIILQLIKMKFFYTR